MVSEETETYADSHLQVSVLVQHASLTGIEMTCKIVAKRANQPSRHGQQQDITHGLHDAVREDDKTSSSCLDVYGLEDEYHQVRRGILYLS